MIIHISDIETECFPSNCHSEIDNSMLLASVGLSAILPQVITNLIQNRDQGNWRRG